MKVVLLPQARENLDSISEPAFSMIVRQIEALGEFPEMGAAMMGPFSGYRSLVVGLFRIIYRLAPKETVRIVYIRDCRRRPLAS